MDPILIIGGGPAGLGAAQYCSEHAAEWLLIERNSSFGGLSSSVQEQGYTWDIGGHVLFSHYPEFDAMVEAVLPLAERLIHRRRAFVRTDNRFIPYPFQYNVGFLSPEKCWECIEGLLDVQSGHTVDEKSSLLAYIYTHFGKGIASQFMVPYNKKIWAHPLDTLSCAWFGERIATVDLKKVLFNAFHRKFDDTWGPNNTFQFPRSGGTGRLWQGLASMLPAANIRLGEEIVSINRCRHEAVGRQGTTYRYDRCISTMPIIDLVHRSDSTDLLPLAERLRYTLTHVVGLGIKGDVLPLDVQQQCWCYFPDESIPFYRSTVFSNYSPENVPLGMHSLMIEVSENHDGGATRETIVENSIDACVNACLVQKKSDIIHSWYQKADFGYPVPTVDRDEILEPLFDSFERDGIMSRGRFGAWRYEVGNMDHSYMQGREAASRILSGTPETVFTGSWKV